MARSVPSECSLCMARVTQCCLGAQLPHPRGKAIISELMEMLRLSYKWRQGLNEHTFSTRRKEQTKAKFILPITHRRGVTLARSSAFFCPGFGPMCLGIAQQNMSSFKAWCKPAQLRQRHRKIIHESRTVRQGCWETRTPRRGSLTSPLYACAPSLERTVPLL